MRLTFQAGTLRLNGVEASDVAVDMETTVKGFDLKTIEAGSVGGAKLSVSGNVLNTPEGPDGDIGISLTAEDPRGLLRLTGLLPRDKAPQWSSVLGKTALKIDLQAKPSADGAHDPFWRHWQSGRSRHYLQRKLYGGDRHGRHGAQRHHGNQKPIERHPVQPVWRGRRNSGCDSGPRGSDR